MSSWCFFCRSKAPAWSLQAQLGVGEGAPSLFPPIIVPNGIDKAMLIMMGLHSHSIDQVPFASPLGFAREAISNDVGRTIMINNSSLQKWDRLAQKQLDQQFMNEIIHGLQCSP